MQYKEHRQKIKHFMQKIKVTKKIQKKTFIALDWKIVFQDKKALAVKEQSDNLDFIKTKNLCSLKDSLKKVKGQIKD